MRKIIVLIAIFSIISRSHAAQEFFKGRSEGWHWYEDRLQKLTVRNQKEKKKQLTATQIIEKQKKDLEAKLHQAILHPTPANVLTYIKAQDYAEKMAQRFGDSWMKVIYQTPSLDVAVQAPVNHIGQRIYEREKEKMRGFKIQNLSKTYGLLFFFKRGCPYCHAFAPIVRQFADQYGFKVMAISMDGNPLDGFDNIQKNNGIAERFNISYFPTLLAVDPKKNNVIPLAHSYLAQNELESRLDLLTTPSSLKRMR